MRYREMWKCVNVNGEVIYQLYFYGCFLVAPTKGSDCWIRRRSEESGNDDGYYCVCNAIYCDKVPRVIKPLNLSTYTLITSSKSGLFFHVSNGVFENIEKTNGKYWSYFFETKSLKRLYE